MSKILDLETATKLLLKGEIVAFPTETVYGLGALANNSHAINQVFEIKNRPKDNPLICHFCDIAQIKKFAKVDKLSEILLTKFSPGPISLLLPLIDQTLLPATCGNPKIVCRIPKHELTLELLTAIKIPLVGPSANTSGFFSPTNAQMVLVDLGNKISGVLDGGNCQVGLESTILEVIDRKIKILRNGVIGKIEIEKYLQKIGQKYEFESQQNSRNKLQSQSNSPSLIGKNKSKKLEKPENLESLEKLDLKKFEKIKKKEIQNDLDFAIKDENKNLQTDLQIGLQAQNNIVITSNSSTIPGQKYAHYKPKTPFFIAKTLGQITKIIDKKIKQQNKIQKGINEISETTKKSNLQKNTKLNLRLKSKLEILSQALNLKTEIEDNDKIVIIATQNELQKLNLIYPNFPKNIEIINIGKKSQEISQNFYQTLFELDQKNAKIGYLLLPKMAQGSFKIALLDKINKAGKYL